MMEFEMTPEKIEVLLESRPVGRISTNGADGYPYTVAVHYVKLGDRIYFHGLPAGEKLDNIMRGPRVCFEVSTFQSVIKPQEGENICASDSKYQSVVIRGTAEVVKDLAEKGKVLKRIAKKYISDFRQYPMPRERIKGTVVIKIKIERISGKYH